MSVALHPAAGHGVFQHIGCGEQGRGAVALVVVRHGGAFAPFEWQARPGVVKPLLVQRQNNGVFGGIEIKADHIAQLGLKMRIVRALEASDEMGLKLMRFPDALGRTQQNPCCLGRYPTGPVRSLVRRRAHGQRDHARRLLFWMGALPGLQVSSRKSPSTPSCAKRRCQRHTIGQLALTAAAMRCAGLRSSDAKMIFARCTCFSGALRLAVIVSSRAQSNLVTRTQNRLSPATRLARQK
jgi:hypothetical protein